MRKRVALAQTLILDPDIILMDEPFSALDIQTRQLMENELLDLWEAKRKAVLFITHDLDEAIAMSDRVVVLSAGPATHPIGEFEIDLPRPRDVAEIRSHPRFVELHAQIWRAMRDEVLKGYRQTPMRAERAQSIMWKTLRRTGQSGIWRCCSAVLVLWYVLTEPDAAAAVLFRRPQQSRVLLRRAAESAARIWEWFTTAARSICTCGSRWSKPCSRSRFGTALGSRLGLWLALSPLASALFDPYIKAANSMPRVILAPIFGVWFGLGIWSKVALGVTLVFFIVFFNVYQGVKEVSPVVLANARMLGANGSICCGSSTCRAR